MKDYKNLSQDYIKERLAEIKQEIRRISRLKKVDKFQLPQVGKAAAELKSFGQLSQEVKDFRHIDSSSHLKYLNDFYDIISLHPAWQKKAQRISLFGRIKSFCSRPFIRRLTQSLLQEQREFNAQLVRFLNQLANHIDSHDELLADKLIKVEQKFDELINEIINKVLVIRNQEMVERIDVLFSKMDREVINLDVMQQNFQQDLEKIIEGQSRIYQTLNELNQNLLLHKRELAELSNQIRGKKELADSLEKIKTKDTLSSEDYLHFEEAFRGTSQQIAAKQSCYLPYFKSCKRVLDIGCGRGDFLHLLKEHKIGAYGIDSNHEMVSYCQQQGLEVIEGDGIEHLNLLEDESIDGIFASQFIEHLAPEHFKSFIQLGYAKLIPGSFMIVETVNPACLHAYLNTFLLDLSHTKALHPLALRFLFEIAGFQKVETLFLSPISAEVRLEEISIPPRMHIKPKRWLASFNRNVERLNKLIFTHQDYAVIGKKGKGKA
jgi:2-polyprenyl-3-methyl-5-hydroxy-6-metoxy-1,4-benzoquinol methylase